MKFELNIFGDIFTFLFHVSNLLAFLAFLLRDQLKLRAVMAVSLFLQGLYYYALPNGPLFDPLFWKVVSFAANMIMIILVFGGSLDFGIASDLRELFNKIGVLKPGQFRKLVTPTKRTGPDRNAILTEGQPTTELHYLLKGEAEIAKGGQTHNVKAGVFLGEVAFLNGTPASATVRLLDGGECLTWDSQALRELMKSDGNIDIALRGVFNRDLAAKVAASMPIRKP